MTETNVFQLSQPGAFTDQLTEVLRNGAKSDALRTLNPNQAGQRSDDCGQLVKAC